MTNTVKALSVATSSIYPVGLPALADQLAINEVDARVVAAVAAGTDGTEFTVATIDVLAVVVHPEVAST